MDPTNFDLAAFAQQLLNAAMSKQWFLLASLALFGVMLLVKSYGAEKWPFLATKTGSALMALFFSTAAALATAFAAPTSVAGWALVLATAKIAGAAWLKDRGADILPWILEKLKLRAPSFAEAKDGAKAAGDAAQAASPAPGAAGVVTVVEK